MVTVYKPRLDDLWFRQLILSDEKTMSYNHSWGGTLSFPKNRWKSWYDYWVANTDGKRYYRYVINEDKCFVGEIAYHFDIDLQWYLADVIIYNEFRGRGYGGCALDILCSVAKDNGINSLYDDIAVDNPAIKMFIEHGFKEEYRTPDKVFLKKDL